MDWFLKILNDRITSPWSVLLLSAIYLITEPKPKFFILLLFIAFGAAHGDFIQNANASKGFCL